MAMSNRQGYAGPQLSQSLKSTINMHDHHSKTAAQDSGWQQLVASQCRFLDAFAFTTRVDWQPSKTLRKASATMKDSRPSSQQAHAAVGDSGNDAPSGEMPKIPACRQQGNEANQEDVFVDAVEHEDELHPFKRMVPPVDLVLGGGTSDTTRRDDDPKPTQEYIPQDQPVESQVYIFAHAMDSDEVEPHPVMEPHKPQKDREPIIVGATGTEEGRRPTEYQTPQDDGNAAPTNTTSEDDMNHRQEAAVEAPQGSSASEGHQKLLQEAIVTTEKAYTLEKHDSPDIPNPICEAEVATLEPPQKRVRLSNPSVQPEEDDVLCCCSRSEKQYGNHFFHRLVEMSAIDYQQYTDDLQKMGVVKYIIEGIMKRNGRFLNQTSDNEWYVVSQTGAIEFALRSLQRQCDRMEEVERQSRRHGPTLQDSHFVNKYTSIEHLDDVDDSSGGTEEISHIRTVRAAYPRVTLHPISSILEEERPARRQIERGHSVEPPSRGSGSTKPWKTVPREYALRVLHRNQTFPFHGIITPGMNTAIWVNIVEVEEWMQRKETFPH